MKKYTQKQKADGQASVIIPDDMLLELIEDYTDYHKWLNTTNLCDVLKLHCRRRLEAFWTMVDSRGLPYNSNWTKELYES